MKYLNILTLTVLALVFNSCDDLLENELASNKVEFELGLSTPTEMQELLNSVYDVVANANNGTGQKFGELLADNVFIPGNAGFLVQVYNRSSDFFNSDVGGYYSQPYIAINRANVVLENADNVGMSVSELDRIKGEAKFLRAISHFELVRYFAQPYGYTPDNTHLGIVIRTSSEVTPQGRDTVHKVYEQVLLDLMDAVSLLPETNGNYATSNSAKAYLAKVYFQMNEFENAAMWAEEVIGSGDYTFSNDINNRYSTSISTESVFTLISSAIENDNSAKDFIDKFRSDLQAPVVQVSDEYYSLLTTNGSDARSAWVNETDDGIRVLTKYNMLYMNVTLASLTEMMLIAAESYGEQNTNLSAAIGYINQIKTRAGISGIPGSSTAALVVIEARNERRIEFGGEGYRVHELKRRGAKGEDVFIRNASWDCAGMVLQFPASEETIEGFVMNPEGGCQ
jgi:starch-binding outer membrane protein, SusD/RagB family